jgi:GDP-L-fucose synthase
MDLHTPIFVAGHRGLVGAALVRRLETLGCTDLRLATRSELDLTDQAAVRDWFAAQRPAYVFLAAARVGGIHANDTYPAEFIYQNLAIELNVIDAAYQSGVRKLQFLGSSCIYPRLAPQPMTEDALLCGPLEPTNEWYAIAKIAGIKLCQAYRRQYGFDAISLMPTNLYGPGDNFDLNNSHVLPALLRRFDEAAASGAPSLTLWGSGTPRREFLHVDDLADAAVYLMQHYSAPEIINVGVGTDVSISELADLVARATGYRGTIHWDTSRPDGPPRKLLDVARLTALGWQAGIPLDQGIAQTLHWYRQQQGALRGVTAA